MIKFDLQNLYKIVVKHGLSKSDFKSKSNLISDYLKKIHARKQGFYSVIDDENVILGINNFAKSLEGEFQDIVILGIGGSALGTICLQQSLKHLFENEFEEKGVTNLHVIDNIDPELISAIEDIIDYEKTLFIVVTKSGTTPETLAQYFYFRKNCDDKNLDPKKHFVFITDPKNGLLRKIGKLEGIKTFDVPENVGGRFSVLTNVSLLPAKLIGINIEELLKGAKEMRDKFLSEKFEENLPFKLALIQFLHGKKGKIMDVLIPYSQRLIKFADWYRQLLAESIGKAKNEKRETVNIGLTPINALGATDQHSQSQLYNEGPNDKFFIFLNVEDLGGKIEIPNLSPNEESVKFLHKVDFGKLLHIEMQGTIQALTKNDRPNIIITIPE